MAGSNPTGKAILKASLELFRQDRQMIWLPVMAAATALGVSRPALSSLLNGKAGLSGEMALRIEKAFGVKMDTLMRMQSAYDIAKTRSHEREIRGIRRFRPAEAHP